MPNFQNYLKDIKSQIVETDVRDVKRLVDANANNASIIDVREQDEYVQGYIPGARWIPRGFLESRIEDTVPERDREIVPIVPAARARRCRRARSRISATRT